jgi:hypothetical protein
MSILTRIDRQVANRRGRRKPRADARCGHRRIAAAPGEPEFDGPVCGIALTYVCEHALPVASHVSAWSAAEREGVLPEAAEDDGWIIWSGADWPHVDFVDPPNEALHRGSRRRSLAPAARTLLGEVQWAPYVWCPPCVSRSPAAWRAPGCY